ncbi:MAG TPA: TonB family protein [Oscillatoriaceae cyanobacterium]
MTQRPRKQQGPYDGIYGIPVDLGDEPAPQPRPKPKAKKVRKAPKRPPTQRRKRAVGVLSWEGSVAAHLAAVLAVLLWPRHAQVPPPKPQVIPIEVSFEAQPVTPQKHVAPPGPQKHQDPKPVPKAPEKPHVTIHHTQAVTKHHAVPRPATVRAPHHGHPAQKAYHQLTQADLIALARKRFDQSDEQDAQSLAALAKASKEGSHSKPQPASGVTQGDPTTNASGMSGALASRAILTRVVPSYPPRAEALGEEGSVRVRVWATPQGGVERVEVLRSSGWSYFDRAAVTAVRQWVFNASPSAGEEYGDVTLYFRLR